MPAGSGGLGPGCQAGSRHPPEGACRRSTSAAWLAAAAEADPTPGPTPAQVGDELAGAIQEGLLRLAEAAAAQDGGSDEGEPFEELEGGASADSGSTEPPAAAAAGAAARSGALLELMQDAQQARRREELARVVGSLEKAWARLRNINVA